MYSVLMRGSAFTNQSGMGGALGIEVAAGSMGASAGFDPVHPDRAITALITRTVVVVRIHHRGPPGPLLSGKGNPPNDLYDPKIQHPTGSGYRPSNQLLIDNVHG